MPQLPASASAATEIKATAHLMLLDPGLYCVSHTEGEAPPDPATGLPGVRLSPAPAPSPFGGQVALCGFGADGWLSRTDDALLLRVIGGPAQVMVTVYQSANGQQEAPKLQVLRLSVPPAPSLAVKRTAEVLAHVYGLGDIGGRIGEWVGERASQRWIEGFAITPQDGVPVEDIEYQAVLGRSWMSPWCDGGQFCGSRFMSLPILGLSVRLRGRSAETHSLSLAATFVDGTVTAPVAGGEPCEAESLAALEAFQIMISTNPIQARIGRKRRSS